MGSPIQIGDIVTLARLAHQVYDYGWNDSLSANTQYAAFGRDIKNLVNNAQLLVEVVDKAERNLRDHGALPENHVRWDPSSLFDILGDYRDTLAECQELVDRNRRYQGGNGALMNIEFNVLVQPTVDRLRERILLHNSRIEHALRPFEIDIMTRIHSDLARRIDKVNENVMHIIGVVVPDLHKELENERRRTVNTVHIPPMVLNALEADFSRHPQFSLPLGYPSLRDISDSFLTNFKGSTKDFRPGLTSIERFPSALAYLNLLKCVFLLDKLKTSEALRSEHKDSHWHTYIRLLEDDLSVECQRFQREMTAPALQRPLPDIILWPEDRAVELLDTVAPTIMMEQVLECPLIPTAQASTTTMRLLRHAESNDERFRIIVAARPARPNPKTPPEQKTVIDFDIRTSHLKPLYARPEGATSPIEMILMTPSGSITLTFTRIKDALMFQQALTGFRPYTFYTAYLPMVSFFANGNYSKEPASVQLWVPYRLQGSLVTNVTAPAAGFGGGAGGGGSPNPSTQHRAGSVASIASTATTTASVRQATGGLNISNNGSSDMLIQSSLRSTQPIARSPPSPRSFLPGGGQFSPGQLTAQFSDPYSSSPPHMSDPRSRAPSLSARTMTVALPDPNHPNDGAISSPPFPRPSRSTAFPYPFNSPTPSSTGTTSTTSSSSKTTQPLTVTTKPASTIAKTTIAATLHVPPIKPLLVLFTRDPRTSALSIITLAIDGLIKPNPERCKCRQADKNGLSTCTVCAIERDGGGKGLEGRILGPYGEGVADKKWDVLRLGLSRRSDPGSQRRGSGGGDEWMGLQRISLLFPSWQEREKFGGRLCFCAIRTMEDEQKCLAAGHLGLIGQVRVWYRRGLSVYQNAVNAGGGMGAVINGVNTDN